jgi:hypothetical protein
VAVATPTRVLSRIRPRQTVVMPESHYAAAAAIAWSPHRRGLLATGGGSADLVDPNSVQMEIYCG